MTDLQLLFLVLVGLYFWECACWVRRGAVAFRTWVGKTYQPTHPAPLLGNQRGGFVFGHPLPPLGTLFTANQLPMSISADAILAFVSPSVNPGSRPLQTEKLLRFEEIRAITVDTKKVMINGEVFLRAASASFALFIADLLRQLKPLPAPNRGTAIQKIVRDTLDIKVIEQRLDKFRQQTHSLRLLANVLFFYLFVIAPVVIYTVGLSRSWIFLLIGLLVFTSSIAFGFRTQHKQFYPQGEEERFTHFLIVLLSPATAIRTIDLLSRPLFEQFHPLAVAKVLCAEAQFRALARDLLRELHYPALPLCPSGDPAGIAAEMETRSFLKAGVESLVKKAGLDPGELLHPPAPADETSRAYCPRCLAQFTTTSGTCADCGGVPLVPFTKTQQKL
ncbi:MAG TPA: hypothetical protein VL361_19460 [Candidatus Limnocylindrales bacterium]|jgi:hypothetical protein|nr:hypothetical protein [Candidatus Limnocylindrales bacterium]